MDWRRIEHRGAWEEFAKDACASAYRDLRDDGELEDGKTLLKRYLVEAHTDYGHRNAAASERVADLLDAVATEMKRGDNTLEVDVLGHMFFRLSYGGATCFLDASEIRYWSLETFERSGDVDSWVRRLTTNGDRLDQVWLPISFQQSLSGFLQAEVKRVSASFKRYSERAASARYDGTREADEEPEDGLIARFGGPDGVAMYQQVAELPQFRNSVALYKSTLRSRPPAALGIDGASLSTVWYSGKMTQRGAWWDALQQTPKALVSAYRAGMKAVDDRKIGIPDNGVRGDFIQFDLGTAVPVETFREEVFGRRSIFRLLLTWEKASGDWVQFDAVDLHAGAPIQLLLEQRRDGQTLRMVVPEDACGNVVPRLLTNLQQFVSALAMCRTFEDPGIAALTRRN